MTKTKLIATLPKDGWQFDTYVVADTISMVVKEGSERFFVRAMQQEVENRRLLHELSACYELLEQAEVQQE